MDDPSNTSVTTDWHVHTGRIALRLPSGSTIFPTASEISRAEFKNLLTIHGEDLPRGPSQAIPQITFHRFPVEALIEVSPPAPDLSRSPEYVVSVFRGSQRVGVLPSLDQDQILIGTDWFPLSSESLEALSSVLKIATIETPHSITLKQYLSLRRSNSDLVIFTSDQGAGQPAGAKVPPAEIPKGLKADLYPYQRTGYQWLSRISDEGLGCVLADQMGLGKTLQVIALMLREVGHRTEPSLVITPATLLENWRRELLRFAPSLSICVHRGRERSGFPKTLQTFNVVVTSYETAMRDISILEMIPWNSVVLDEAQAIKTPDAQRTVILKTLPRRTAVVVSGTPVENRLRDLWSLMDFAVPGLLGTLKDFESHYTDDEANATKLEPLVSPLILRRLVVDVAKDLPERIDIPQPIELSEETAARYDAIRAEILAQYGNAASLVVLTKLRMFCTHPFLIDGGSGDPLPHSTKYARLLEILNEVFANSEKVLIFTSYTAMADLLAVDLRQRYGIPVEVIDGRTPVIDRQPTVDRFYEVKSSAALVLNPRAAGTGLNITAANHVVHYNLEWNPAVEDQATARAHRRGQTRPVTVHRLFHPGTVEEVIDERMARKRVIAGHAVVGTDGDEDGMADILRSLELSPVHGDVK